MTDTDLITADRATESAAAPVAIGGSLTTMVLPELRARATKAGVRGVSGMRKGDLIAAILEREGQGAATAAPATTTDEAGAAVAQAPAAPRRARRSASRTAGAPVADAAAPGAAASDMAAPDAAPAAPAPLSASVPVEVPPVEVPPTAAAPAVDAASAAPVETVPTVGTVPTVDAPQAPSVAAAHPVDDASVEAPGTASTEAPAREKRTEDGGTRQGRRGNQGGQNGSDTHGGRPSGSNGGQSSGQNSGGGQGGKNAQHNGTQGGQNGHHSEDDDDEDGRQGRRGRRFRDRRRRGERTGADGAPGSESEVREDDVVQPVAGILDVLDNYAFVRTSGYLAGPNDVYVSMNMVRKNGLRRGDAVTGAVRLSKETGESSSGGGNNPRQKFNPLVRLDTVNGGSIDEARRRPEFGKLTPLYPNQRLRLETGPDRLTTRVIDLIMPIGKGQRALIVSPPKAGKTTIMQDIANAITRNNPECHLMVVLVDERPEEVTDMQRSVKGEVIASTFDRPPADHTQAAELAIERAKRLVEQGKDVVVLLDSITRLGRAYNNASPASGRILSGGVDSTALYPPKRFLGAARNIEDGGSLTIIATAMVETGSTGDTVIFEEFKGTGNAELKLDRKIAERRVFPAVDVNPSGTRKDELLLSSDEFAVVHKLRRVLSGLDSHQAIDLLMSQLRKTKTNYEFLVQVSKNTPGGNGDD